MQLTSKIAAMLLKWGDAVAVVGEFFVSARCGGGGMSEVVTAHAAGEGDSEQPRSAS